MAIGYVSAIHDIEVIQLTNFLILTIFDPLTEITVLTLNDEQNSWSMGKALFIINRYYSLIATVVSKKTSDESLFNDDFRINHYAQQSSGPVRCFRYFHWEGGGGLITCIITETILLMRLYAMYALDKRILSLMLVGFVLSIASQGAVVGVAFKDVRDTETLLCVPLLPTFSYSFWIPRLAFETVLCILALIRGFQLQKDEIGDTDWSGNDLMKMLIRDSIGYYIVADSLNYTLNTQDVRYLSDVLGGLDNKSYANTAPRLTLLEFPLEYRFHFSIEE
ncbi:hypothetical protein F5051DRAFT_432393 [Lentinula edodes]|nr:hypothetical protein F5051DRAFT_432393 [Lentinula edodes]